MTDNNDDGFKSKGFDYDSLVEDGLKDVVKRVLKITSETGLIGNSHFFISFNGDDPDVIVPNELKTTDNSEIKIIIQHQFWDLKSTDNHFEVTLSFNGKKKNISVPFTVHLGSIGTAQQYFPVPTVYDVVFCEVVPPS